MSYGESETLSTVAGLASRPVKPSVTEALERERKGLGERMAEIDEALAVLKQYPDVQKVIDTLSKHTRF